MNQLIANKFCSACLLAGMALGMPAYAAETSSVAEEEQVAAEPQPEVISLGRFQLREFRATEGAKIRLSFALYAEVDAERGEAIRELVSTHEHRIRDEVITAVRTAVQSDFHEPELTRFRRRILFRLRRAADYLPIERLLIGEFEYLLE